MGKRNSVFRQMAQRKNMWVMRMLRLARSAIQWEGLPDYLDITYLEQCLIRSGSAIIVYDEIADEYVVGGNSSVGLLDIYGYPINRSVIFRNGNKMNASVENSVIIWNTPTHDADLWMYNIIADDLCNIDMAVRTNVNTQKTMPIIPINQEQLLSAKNLMQDIAENQPYKFVDPMAMNVEAFKSALQFDNRKSFTADQLIEVERELWNRALTLIGINNTNVEKRERVNTFETNSNLDEILIMRRDKLNSREYACKKMKEKFGLDVSVKYYSDVMQTSGLERSGSNGGIYSAVTNDSPAGLAESES